MSKLSVELVKHHLLEEDEVKRAKVAQLKLRNKGRKEIKNPTAGLERSRRYDQIAQIVQEPKYVAEIKPKKTGDLIPTADFAGKYTDKMPHGQAGGYAKKGAENQKSPKVTSATSMKPNQETKLKDVSTTIQKAEDDGNQEAFRMPQADYAYDYTAKMPHGQAGGYEQKEEGGQPSPTGYGEIEGGPTRKGGTRQAKLGGRVVGAHDADSQTPDQVGQPGKEKSKPDALKWGAHDFKKETHGAQNIVESGIMVRLNGKKKAVFDVVNHNVLKRMFESYDRFGYEVSFERVNTPWKKDKTLLGLLRESVDAKYNFAPQTHKAARKAALNRFAHLVRGSYNGLYENRQEFVETVSNAFKKVETLAEKKYLDQLEIFEGIARIRMDDALVDVELITEATGHKMALRQIRNRLHEEYGFDTDIVHIFVDGVKYKPTQVVEYKVRNPKALREWVTRRKVGEGYRDHEGYDAGYKQRKKTAQKAAEAENSRGHEADYIDTPEEKKAFRKTYDKARHKGASSRKAFSKASRVGKAANENASAGATSAGSVGSAPTYAGNGYAREKKGGYKSGSGARFKKLVKDLKKRD